MPYPSGAARAGSVDVVIIGAGHSGLAMSHLLTARSIDHVILERGEIANSWANERWDSLKLLTPNWMSRLPGYQYSGCDPDGYMSVDEVVRFIKGYANVSHAPVVTHTEVKSVQSLASGYRVLTNRGEWRTRAVVIASGAFNVPLVPSVSEGLPGDIMQLTTRDYRNAEALPDGGVLVVGAASIGAHAEPSSICPTW